MDKKELMEKIEEKFPKAEIKDLDDGNIFLSDMFPVKGEPLMIRVYFPGNIYGASIIRHSGSYGAEQGLFELAVLKNDKLCYETDITSDVLPRLTSEEVLSTLEEIEGLMGDSV